MPVTMGELVTMHALDVMDFNVHRELKTALPFMGEDIDNLFQQKREVQKAFRIYLDEKYKKKGVSDEHRT
jgi:hypothetical protein